MQVSHKYLRLYITKYHFAMQEELHNKKMLKILKNIPEIKMTNLYAIVQTDKLAVDLDSIKINNTYEISCDLMINNNKKAIKFNLLKYYYEELEDKQKISFEEFVKYLENTLLNIEPFSENNEKKENLYKYINIIKHLSQNSQITIECPFYWICHERKYKTVSLNIYRILNHFNLNILNELEIIYIGKSMKSTLDRLKEHNKWSAVLAKDKINPMANYDYLVYVFNFDKVDTVANIINKKETVILNYESNYDLERLVKNLEIAFISHYKPLLNIDHIDTIFQDTDFVKKELVELNYTNLMIEMNIIEESVMGNLKTPKAKSQLVDIHLFL